MGRGLLIKENGIHVAFTGGTGALVFLDLVSRLVLSNNRILPIEKCYAEDFKFHFYVSFKNEEHGIGIELCKKLVEMN